MNDPELTRLRSEAEPGDAQAWYRLALALVAQQQMEEGFTWHRRAAETGFAPAQVECARMLLYGVGVAENPKAAADLLLRAEQGHPAAGYLLALIALGDVALPRDGRINERMLAAVQANFPPALRAAAIHFGRKPDAGDQTLCLQLLERGAQRGDAIAALLLAQRLAHGEGCTADPAAAAELHQQLAQAGIAPLPSIHIPLPAHGAESMQAATLAFEEALQPPPAQTLSTQPQVAQIDGLLSADECRLLIASAQPMLQRSYTLDPGTGQSVAKELRTSSDASFDPIVEDFALRVVQLRIARAAQVELVHAEHLIVLQYQPGQEYRPHRDYLPPATIERDPRQAGNRVRTICVYLNHVEAGGETEFPVAGVRIAPQPGRAVVFDNVMPDGRPDPDSLHAGLPVLRGEKWLATLWLRQGRYRQF